MNNVTLDYPGINQRELTYYILFATITSFFIFITGLSVWFYSGTAEPSTWVTVGQISDFPVPNEQGEIRPYRIPITDSDYVWVTHNEGEIRVFSPYTTMRWLSVHGELGCRYAWNRASGRFEDPCSGSKYRLDGVIISGPATHDLNQYTTTIEQDGEILINTNQLTAGQCRQLYTGSSRAISYKVWQETPPECDI